MRASGPLPHPRHRRRLRARPAPDLRASPTASPRCGRSSAARNGPSERAWEMLGRRTRQQPARRAAARPAVAGGFPPRSVWRSTACCAPTSTPTSRRRRSPAAASTPPTEMARRLGIDDAHVITGHTHRGRPAAERSRVAPPRRRPPPQHRQLGLRLRLPPPRARRPSPYWPGTVTWLEDDGPPRRVQPARTSSSDASAAEGRR